MKEITKKANKKATLAIFAAQARAHVYKAMRVHLSRDRSTRNIAGLMDSKVPGITEIIDLQFKADLSNLIQYILIIEVDLWCLLEDMVVTRSRWKKRLYARLIAITMFECFDDLNYLLGKPLRDQLMKAHLSHFETNRQKIHSQFSALNKKYKAPLKIIRNCSIGHREHSVEKQLEAIASFKPVQMYKIAYKYIILNRKALSLLLLPIEEEMEQRYVELSNKMNKKLKEMGLK